jgi:predicted nucleic acid-binding protein
MQIIDNNVVASTLIQRSYPFLIIDELFFEDEIQLRVSVELIQEYFDVLARPRLTRFPHFTNKAEIRFECSRA